jgi:hypothetical protein
MQTRTNPIALIGGSNPPADPAMSRSEREDLQRLIRQREKVLKSAAKQRSAELLADFENQMGQEYSFDQDEVWAQAVKSVEPLVRKAQAQIIKRCRDLGIPRQFAPSMRLHWSARGYDNEIEKRRQELRRMALSQIDAIEAKAITEIELSCLKGQELIAMAGLTSTAARQFVEQLPTLESLMPHLSFQEIAGEAEPPVAEQLLSPNALRQRRFRERQAASRNAAEPLQVPLHNGGRVTTVTVINGPPLEREARHAEEAIGGGDPQQAMNGAVA